MSNNLFASNMVLFTIIFLGVTMVFFTIFIIKSRTKIFDKEIEYQKKIHSSILNAQENERNRIARDLHDDVSSKLIALSLNLHLLKSAKTPDTEKSEIINTIEQITNATIETSRKMAHNLFPPMFEKFGLNEALEEIVEDYNKSKQIKIKYSSSINLSVLEKNYQLPIFRITQELISNSIKHGKATEILIEFGEKDLNYYCQYEDNGKGLSNFKFNDSKGLGFINIENRIETINGNYSIDFNNMNGFKMKYFF